MVKLKTTGIVSQSGRKYVQVRLGNQRAFLPLEVFAESAADIKRRLIANGLTVLGNKSVTDLQNDIERLEWKTRVVAETVGWVTPSLFALHNGSIVGEIDKSPPLIAFEPNEAKGRESGKISEWKSRVARPLSDHAIPSFALCFAFAPPLLAMRSSENILFEIVGVRARGKSTVQKLISTVWGSPSRTSAEPYWVTMRTTVNGLEPTMLNHRDFPIIMDEANLFETENSNERRAKAFEAIAFILASGAEKDRFNMPARREAHRLGFLSSANKPLSELLAQSDEAADAAKSRLLTIPINPSREFGIFDSCPDKYEDMASFIANLVSNSESHYGLAGPRFVEALSNERAADEEALKKKIDDLVEQFRSKVGVDRNDGIQLRISEAFGLVYAAGKLAKEYRCLPKNFKFNGVGQCYRLSRSHSSPGPSFMDRLIEIKDAEDTVIWSKKRSKKVSKAHVVFCPKRSELWIRQASISKVLPDWNLVRRQQEVQAAIKTDSGRTDAKRKMGAKLKSVRAYVFDLSTSL